MSRSDQGKSCGSVARSVEGNDASTEFDDTSRSRVSRKQSRVEQCNSRIAGRSAMAPSKNSSSTDRSSRDRGEHRTDESPNSSFRGVDSGGMKSDRTVERPDRGGDRRKPVSSRSVQRKRKTRDLFPNVEVIEGDRSINVHTLTADDRRVLNVIDAILVVRKEVIHSFPMIRAVMVIVTIPMMIDDAVQGVVGDVVMVAVFHRAVVVEIIPMMIIRGRRTTVHRAKMTMSGFPECRDRGSNCKSLMEVSIGRAGGHTSKTALRTIVGVNATNWRL